MLMSGPILTSKESSYFVLIVRKMQQYVAIIFTMCMHELLSSNVIDLSLVDCFGTVECTNSTFKLGTMTAAECCIGDSEGLAYTADGSEECHVCIGM